MMDRKSGSATDGGVPAPVRIVLDARDVVGESAVWDAGRRRLVWVDIIGRRILSLDPATGDARRWPAPDFVTSIGLARDGRAVVGLHRHVALWDWAERFEPLARIEPDRPGNRLNEGVVAPDGTFWVGTMAENFDATGDPIEMTCSTGALYEVTPRGGVRRLCEDVFGITNTLVWPTRDSLVTADTLTNTLYCYRIAHHGLCDRRALLTDYPRGLPDGSCLDAEGYVWNCRVGGACVIRLAPDGRLDRVVDLPVSSPTSCTFGGDDLATLYLTSARFGMDAAHLAANPQEGAIVAFEPGVTGMPANLFGA